jgi:hypothetical protein
MSTVARSFAVAGVLALTAGLATAQGRSHESNPMFLNNGADLVYIFSDPSVGSTTGQFPPYYQSDLFTKTYPGDALLTWDGVVEISGQQEAIFDTDWTTSPSIYARLMGGTCDNPGGPGNEVADFFCGPATGVFVAGANFGLQNPCTLTGNPLGCTGACPPTGYVVGYNLSLSYGSPIVIPADGVTGTAVTYFFPGGMTFTSGAAGQCGMGDYILQDLHSTDENVDDPGALGYSQTSSYQLGFSGAIPDLLPEVAEASLEFSRPMITTYAQDTTLGWGPESGQAALSSDASSGGLQIGVEVVDLYGSVAGGAASDNLVIGAASISGTLPMPGVNVLGGNLMLIPDPVFNSTASLWVGTINAVGQPASDPWIFGEGYFGSSLLGVTASGLDVWVQGFSIDQLSVSAEETNVFKMDVN